MKTFPPQSSGGGGSTAWNDVTGKPSTFTPSAHTHPISDVTGLQTALDGKAASSHAHVIADTTGLQAALDGKQAAGSYAAATHSHVIADTTGLQTALDGKAAQLAYIKTADETRVSSTAYTTDAHMVSGTLETGKVYEFVLMFLCTGSTTEDMRFRMDRSGLSDAGLWFTAAVATIPAPPATWGSNTNINLAGSAMRQVHMRGVLITGTDTGTISVAWGQQVSGAPTDVTTMKAGSFMLLRKLN